MKKAELKYNLRMEGEGKMPICEMGQDCTVECLSILICGPLSLRWRGPVEYCIDI